MPISAADRPGFVGTRFGRLTILGKAGVTAKHKRLLALCRCDCGGIKVVAWSDLQKGHVKSCGCLLRRPPGAAARNRVLSWYKKNSVRRGFDWGLTDEQAAALFSSACHYCGAAPSKIAGERDYNGRFLYNGIDRIDSSLGYVPGNVVPCCHPCNWSKSDRSVGEFFEHIRRICQTHPEILIAV